VHKNITLRLSKTFYFSAFKVFSSWKYDRFHYSSSIGFVP